MDTAFHTSICRANTGLSRGTNDQCVKRLAAVVLLVSRILAGTLEVTAQCAGRGCQQPEQKKADAVAAQPADRTITAAQAEHLWIEDDEEQNGCQARGQKGRPEYGDEFLSGRNILLILSHSVISPGVNIGSDGRFNSVIQVIAFQHQGVSSQIVCSGSRARPFSRQDSSSGVMIRYQFPAAGLAANMPL